MSLVNEDGEGEFLEDEDHDLFLSFECDGFADLFGDANSLLLLQPDEDGVLVIEDDDDNNNNKKPSPDSSSGGGSWGIREVEEMLLMEDEGKQAPAPPDHECFQEIFSQILHQVDQDVADDHASAAAAASAKEEEDHDDLISKKRKRQLRNRDAALRSRERKKMYVKELEMKSRYLEGECMRLQRLLHCCAAQNHALRLHLHNSAKQESAVLLLESLLLGSLLWWVGIVCLLPLPSLLCPALEAAMLLSMCMGGRDREIIQARGAKNEEVGLGTLRLFFKCKRCKATRGRMKILSFTPSLLA